MLFSPTSFSTSSLLSCLPNCLTSEPIIENLYYYVKCIFTTIPARVFFLTPKSIAGKKPSPLKFIGGWLLTSPEEELNQQVEAMPEIEPEPDSVSTQAGNMGIQVGSHA